MSKKDLLGLNPVENYKAPKLPSLNEAKDDPNLLKKLPSRWAKNAAVITCMGIMGTVLFTGCYDRSHHGGAGGFPLYVCRHTESECDCETFGGYIRQSGDYEYLLRTHHGGSIGSPFYVVYLTEQEALSIIREAAEKHGLRFDHLPPDYSVEVEGWWGRGSSGDRNLDINLFDARKGVGIALMNTDISIGMWGNETIENAKRDFANLNDDINVGVFYQRGEFIGPQWSHNLVDGTVDHTYTDEEKAEAAATQAENLRRQVQNFVQFLRDEGVI